MLKNFSILANVIYMSFEGSTKASMRMMQHRGLLRPFWVIHGVYLPKEGKIHYKTTVNGLFYVRFATSFCL